MLNKIGLEETFAIPETVMDSGGPANCKAERWNMTENRLLDLGEARLEEMDKYGMEMMVISLNSPAIQGIKETKRAVEVAKKANDTLAEAIAKYPKRFAGFAALPMQDPDLAAQELTRCIKDYGFVGALANGFTFLETEPGYAYYDQAEYWDFWGEVAKFDIPFYVHPRKCLDATQQTIYKDHEHLIASVWGFTVETGTHALRLMGSGLFDKYPNLQIILGHLGEALPCNIWRTTHRLTREPYEPKHKKPFTEYFLNNFHITTSGDFRLAPLLCAMMEMGSDRILFATDWPFEDVSHAANWFDGVEISETDREKIGRLNAIKLLKLDL